MRERKLRPMRSTAAVVTALLSLSMVFSMMSIQVAASAGCEILATTGNSSDYIWSPDGSRAAYEENLDGRCNGAVGNWSIYTAHPSDLSPPNISDITWSPSEPFWNEPIDVSATVSDEDGVGLVLVDYFDGVDWRNLTMSLMSSSPPLYWARLPALGTAGTIQIWVMAWDSLDNLAYTDLMDIQVRQGSSTTTQVPTTMTLPNSTDPMLGVLVLGAIFVGFPASAIVCLLLSDSYRRNRSAM